ncbi:MAG: SIS domain-containing protein [Candidatus Andersenbacteria bacterium]|nr:SIS domain-containing protein [Candidatus Andersenbacteria bacterium]
MKVVDIVSDNTNTNAKQVGYFQEDNIEKAYELIMNSIENDKSIFFKGKGISGLIAEKAARRLNHLYQAILKKSGKKVEIRVFVISESSTPRANKDDSVFIVSGSGDKETLNPLAKKTIKNNANLVLLSSFPDSIIGELANIVIEIPGRVLDRVESSMPLGTTFEMTADVILTAINALIIERNNITEEDLKAVHTDLE